MSKPLSDQILNEDSLRSPRDETACSKLIQLVDRYRHGDEQARELLLEHSYEQLRRIVRGRLHTFPDVKRWEETADVLQYVAIALHRALNDCRPETARQFFALAGKKIREQLLDLKKKYNGPLGIGANHATHELPIHEMPAEGSRQRFGDPARLAEWAELDDLIDTFDPEVAEVVNLHFYQGMEFREVALIMDMSVKSVSRRWQIARMKIGDWLGRAME